jgi:hypothetical protein
MSDRLDLIAAFADGESVPAMDLEAALGFQDARAYLIDVLALRGLVTDAKPAGASIRSTVPARRRWSPWQLSAAAALFVGCVVTGYMVGRETAPATPATPRVDLADPNPSSVAPAPTHIFRIENGVNWNERSGGN